MRLKVHTSVGESRWGTTSYQSSPCLCPRAQTSNCSITPGQQPTAAPSRPARSSSTVNLSAVTHLPFAFRTEVKNVKWMFIHLNQTKSQSCAFIFLDKTPERLCTRFNQFLLQHINNWEKVHAALNSFNATEKCFFKPWRIISGSFYDYSIKYAEHAATGSDVTCVSYND